MLLKAHLFSSLLVQIGAILSLLFIYYNPFVKKIAPITKEIALLKKSASPALLKEGTGISVDVWSQDGDTSYHYHLTSPKEKTWINQSLGSRLLIEEFSDPELTVQEAVDKSPFKELYFLSSEKAKLNLTHFDLLLLNATILFDNLSKVKPLLSGNGFAESITISSFSSSPSLHMKGFSGYLNSPMEAL